MRDTAYRALQVKERLTARTQREPDAAEIAKEMGVSRQEVYFALDAISEPISIYEPVFSDGGESICVMDQIGDTKNTDDSWIEQIALQGAVSSLDEREKRILALRFFDGKTTRFLAAEPESCPKLTRGEFAYDFGDETGFTPLLPMFTLGHNFKPANIHAGGLRYHGAGTVFSQLLKDGYIDAVDIPQTETFKAGVLFAQHEGIVPAPESSHAIAATVREALKCKETGEEKVILFNLSGHGLIDMTAYDQYFAGDLVDSAPTDETIKANLESIKSLQ